FEWAVYLFGGLDRASNYVMFPNTTTPVAQAWNSGSFVRADGPSLPRAYHTTTVLPDQSLLFVGGDQPGNSYPIAECRSIHLDGTISPTCPLANNPGDFRRGGIATWLPTGKLLLYGGAFSSEEFDPATASFGRNSIWTTTATVSPLLNGTFLFTTLYSSVGTY